MASFSWPVLVKLIIYSLLADVLMMEESKNQSLSGKPNGLLIKNTVAEIYIFYHRVCPWVRGSPGNIPM